KGLGGAWAAAGAGGGTAVAPVSVAPVSVAPASAAAGSAWSVDTAWGAPAPSMDSGASDGVGRTTWAGRSKEPEVSARGPDVGGVPRSSASARGRRRDIGGGTWMLPAPSGRQGSLPLRHLQEVTLLPTRHPARLGCAPRDLLPGNPHHLAGRARPGGAKRQGGGAARPLRPLLDPLPAGHQRI